MIAPALMCNLTTSYSTQGVTMLTAPPQQLDIMPLTVRFAPNVTQDVFDPVRHEQFLLRRKKVHSQHAHLGALTAASNHDSYAVPTASFQTQHTADMMLIDDAIEH